MFLDSMGLAFFYISDSIWFTLLIIYVGSLNKVSTLVYFILVINQ